jgi:hypothetical protein
MPASFAFTPIPPSRTEQPSRPQIVSELAGLWRGRLISSSPDAESVVPFTLIRDASVDAAVAGRFLFFTTREIPPTGVKLLEAAQSTFVALIGPYFDPAENADVVTVLEGRRVDSEVTGEFSTRLIRGWRRVKSGRFTATRSERPSAAA